MGDKSEHPILFSGPMVRAILEGRKTQTRRVIRFPDGAPELFLGRNCADDYVFTPTEKWGGQIYSCPFGKPSDRLWVRETFADHYCTVSSRGRWQYKATAPKRPDCGWSSPIHMPRAASRITLEITNVRVERLQEISELDAMAEGVEWEDRAGLARFTATKLFAAGWDALNAKRGYSWESNPWVWVIEFKKL